MKYLRRFLGFLAGRLVVISIVCVLMILAFYMALNTSNIYILLSDGMQERANVILTGENPEELNGFFESDYLAQDETLNIALSGRSPYQYYRVTAFNYEMSMEWMWAWPWEDSAEATIVETVPRIVGNVRSEYKSQAKEGSIPSAPPEWVGGRYTVTLKRTNGVWRIAGLKQTQIIVNPTPVPAPAGE